MTTGLDPIAAEMRSIRRNLGWSLERAAEKTGVPAVVLGSWERGDRRPMVERIRPVLAVYGHQLVVIGPDERVVSTAAGGQEQLVWVVAYGAKHDGLIECESADEALVIADHMPRARIGYRVVRRTGLEFVDIGELRRSRRAGAS